MCCISLLTFPLSFFLSFCLFFFLRRRLLPPPVLFLVLYLSFLNVQLNSELVASAAKVDAVLQRDDASEVAALQQQLEQVCLLHVIFQPPRKPTRFFFFPSFFFFLSFFLLSFFFL